MKITLFILSLTALTVLAIQPGIKFTITPAAVKNFNDNVVPKIMAKMKPIRVPDHKEKGLKVDKIVVPRIALPAKGIISKFGANDLTVGSSNFGVIVYAHAKVHVLFFPVGIHITATCHHSAVQLQVGFGYENNRVKVHVKDFFVRIKNLDVKFGKGLIASIAHHVVKSFQGTIQNEISKMVTQQVRKQLEGKINAAIAKLPPYAKISNSNIGVNYLPTQAPIVTPSYIALALDGTFFDMSKGRNVPPVPPAGAMPDYDASVGTQVQLFLSDYMLNTGLYVGWEAGYLKIDISTALLGPKANFRLNNAWLSQYVPQTKKLYDDQTEMILHVEAKNAPTLKFIKDNIGVKGLIFVQLLAEKDGQRVEIFAVECDIDIFVHMEVMNWNLLPRATGGQIQSTRVVRLNKLTTLDTTRLQAGLNQVAALAIPRINLSRGVFELPSSPDVVMTAVSSMVQNGYLQINANPTFQTDSVANTDLPPWDVIMREYEHNNQVESDQELSSADIEDYELSLW